MKTYDLDLDVNFAGAFVKGNVAIDIEGAENRLVLHAAEMSVKKVTLNGARTSFVHDRAAGTLTIPGSPENVKVDIDYEKRVSDDTIFGLYKSRYGKDYVLATDLEPAQARTVFPCKDDPSYKAVFRLRVVTEKGLAAISNSPVKTKKQTSDGRTEFVFEDSPRMSTYLFFLGVGRFEEARAPSGNAEVIAATRPGQSKNTKFILGIAAAVLQDYERYFDVPYPLKKLHLVALPEYHTGAMENWGAIAAREARVLLDNGSSVYDRRRAALTMTHEIGHMWFGDLVTMKWWDDLWLNESFATFIEHRMIERLHPEWDPWREFLRFDTFRSMNADALSTTHPVQVKVETVDEVEQIFDAISYGKGAAVLRMLEAFIGEAAFRRGVSNYLKEHSYSNATGEDLWRALGRASATPIERVTKAWITKPGFPLVRAALTKGGLTVSQTRFHLDGRESDELWPVPLIVRVDGKDQSILMEKKSVTLKARKDSTILVNPRRTGFYAVLYDSEGYDRLARRFGRLNSHDRAGILNDLYLFLQAGKVAPEVYFRFVSLSAGLLDSLLVETVTDHLANLRAIADEARIVRDVSARFYDTQIRRLGLSPRKGEDETFGSTRETLTAQLVRVNGEYARKLARKFERYSSVDPNLRAGIAIAYAVTKGAAAFDPLVKLVKRMDTEIERAKIYSALTAFDDPDLVERALELGISGEVSRSDSGYTMTEASINPKARATLWRWLVKRYDKVYETYGGAQQFYIYLDRVIPRCGIGHETEVRRFISGKRYKTGEMTFKRTLEKLDINSKLRQRLLST